MGRAQLDTRLAKREEVATDDRLSNKTVMSTLCGSSNLKFSCKDAESPSSQSCPQTAVVYLRPIGKCDEPALRLRVAHGSPGAKKSGPAPGAPGSRNHS